MTQVDVSKGEFYHTWPTFLPDGKHFLYFRSGPPDVEGMYVGSLDVDAGDQSRQRILTSSVPAVYANGYVFFPRAGTLMAQPFDARRLELQGVPVPVAQDVQITWYFTGVFSVSDNGVLVYRTASASGTIQLAWVDRQGKTLSTFGPPGTDRQVALSPDGKRAVVKDTPYNVPGDLWTLDVASGRRTRFTFHKEAYRPVCGLRTAPALRTRPAIWATRYTRKPPPAWATSRCCSRSPGCGIIRPAVARRSVPALSHPERCQHGIRPVGTVPPRPQATSDARRGLQ